MIGRPLSKRKGSFIFQIAEYSAVFKVFTGLESSWPMSLGTYMGRQ